jgi:hypothetical protein
MLGVATLSAPAQAACYPTPHGWNCWHPHHYWHERHWHHGWDRHWDR